LSEPTDNKPKKKAAERRAGVKLDQILKLLFKVSNKTLVNTINGLFNENFAPDDITVKVSKTATEIIKATLDVLRADMFLKVDNSDKRRHFHIEYELRQNNKMGLRVFEYGILKALETSGEDNSDDIILPKAIVIHFEESAAIPDKYTKGVVFPSGIRVEYTVDVLKYWTLSSSALVDKKLYNLLPLQLFTLRTELDKITADGSEQSKATAIATAKSAINKIVPIVAQLYQDNEINADDNDKIITGLAELVRHLDERYKLNEKLSGVNDVIKVLNIAKKAEQDGEKRKAIEIAAEMLLNDEPMDKIMKYTKLTERQLQKIKKDSQK
jgi:hypothetical protein